MQPKENKKEINDFAQIKNTGGGVSTNFIKKIRRNYMKDLMFSYDDKNGEKIHKVYNHIFDFTDEIEAKAENAPALDKQNVDAYFFENPMTRQHFSTVEDLYYHCKLIME